MLRRFTFYEAHMASFTTETTKFWWSLFVRTSFGGTSHYTNICPAVELRSWWKSYFWAKKNCHNNKRPNVFKGSYLGKTPTKGCSHSDWEYILMPTQSFLLMAEILRSPVEVGRKYPIIYRVLYIPGGDRQISEPSTDIQPWPESNLSSKWLPPLALLKWPPQRNVALLQCWLVKGYETIKIINWRWWSQEMNENFHIYK